MAIFLQKFQYNSVFDQNKIFTAESNKTTLQIENILTETKLLWPKNYFGQTANRMAKSANTLLANFRPICCGRSLARTRFQSNTISIQLNYIWTNGPIPGWARTVPGSQSGTRRRATGSSWRGSWRLEGDSIVKFQLEFWLEKCLEFWLQIPYTPKFVI